MVNGEGGQDLNLIEICDVPILLLRDSIEQLRLPQNAGRYMGIVLICHWFLTLDVIVLPSGLGGTVYGNANERV